MPVRLLIHIVTIISLSAASTGCGQEPAKPAPASTTPEQSAAKAAQPSFPSKEYAIDHFGITIRIPESWRVMERQLADGDDAALQWIQSGKEGVVFDARSAAPQELSPTDVMSWFRVHVVLIPPGFKGLGDDADSQIEAFLSKYFEKQFRMSMEQQMPEGSFKCRGFKTSKTVIDAHTAHTIEYDVEVRNISGNWGQAHFAFHWIPIGRNIVQFEAKHETASHQKLLKEMLELIKWPAKN